MADDIDLIEAMRRDLVAHITRGTGLRENLVVPAADAYLAWLQERWGGTNMYIPKLPRRWDLLTIDAELRRGESPKAVAAKHGTSVRQLRRLFPGGLPQPDQDAVA